MPGHKYRSGAGEPASEGTGEPAVSAKVAAYLFAYTKAQLRELIDRDDVQPGGWYSTQHQSLVTRHAYRGVNRILTSLTAAVRGWHSPFWVTARQAIALGGRIKPLEYRRYVPACLFREIQWAKNDNGERKLRSCLLPARFYRLYNTDQADGLIIPASPSRPVCIDPLQAARSLVMNLAEVPEIHYGGDRSYYNVLEDFINLKDPSLFPSPARHANSLLHEAVHFSLRRVLPGTRYEFNKEDSAEYAIEEVWTQLTTSWLLAHLGIDDPELTRHSASYCQGWLSALTGPKALFVIGSRSQRIFDWMTHAVPASEPIKKTVTADADAV